MACDCADCVKRNAGMQGTCIPAKISVGGIVFSVTLRIDDRTVKRQNRHLSDRLEIYRPG